MVLRGCPGVGSSVAVWLDCDKKIGIKQETAIQRFLKTVKCRQRGEGPTARPRRPPPSAPRQLHFFQNREAAV